MIIVDANIILRFLLNDVEELSEKATEILENNEVFIPNKVIVEIVYVLEKVYSVKNDEISYTLMRFFKHDNIKVSDLDIIEEALDLYGRRKFDFVDTLFMDIIRLKDTRFTLLIKN